MWWDDDTIERTVTKEFVCSRLVPREIERLDQPLDFGDNLTDCTYWEWIDEKAKKLFLIVSDLGLPDQIFGLIDDSLDDDDLPIALDQVERLELTPSKDEKTEWKFYQRQFHYLLRPLQKGGHIDYDDDEVVPLDVVDKKHAVGQHIDKVTLPNEPGTVFCRCRMPLGPGHLSWEVFISEINGIKDLQDEHLLSYWTSYTHQGYGYILFTPAPEFSLKSLLTATPSCLKNLDKKARRELVMNWILCLVGTVSSLHNKGLSHGNIRPSTVMFTNDNLVVFTGFTRFHTTILSGVTDNTSFDKEAYDHAAPEKLFKPASSSPTSLQRPTTAEPGSNSSPTSMHTSSNPNPQAADIFSLGCVILELISFLFKKQGRPFAAHRAAKHKSAGRGGAVPDSSFHKNLGQVESWMAQLAKEASKKKDDAVFKGVAPLLHVVERMLAFYPSERPSADEVRGRVCHILVESCGFTEVHCAVESGGLDFGIGNVSLDSSLASTGSSGSFSSLAKRSSSGLEDTEHNKRSGRKGSDSTGSMQSANSPAPSRDGKRGRTSSTSTSNGSQKVGNHTLPVSRGDKKSQWQAPLYQGKYFVLLNSSIRETEMEWAEPRTRQGSRGSQKSAEEVLVEDRANKWQTSMYRSQYGSALRAI